MFKLNFNSHTKYLFYIHWRSRFCAPIYADLSGSNSSRRPKYKVGRNNTILLSMYNFREPGSKVYSNVADPVGVDSGSGADLIEIQIRRSTRTKPCIRSCTLSLAHRISYVNLTLLYTRPVYITNKIHSSNHQACSTRCPIECPAVLCRLP